ncbi:MAG: ribonuclease H-like domain-containing protein [Candidatus Thermoplasmatota archaeon]|nr:ribonuclease H-like domain-containing protein [Candidatus Thermoplasmatota archaeon]
MVLERSFVLLDRVGELTERRIWDQGINTWDDFLDADFVSPFSRQRKETADVTLEQAKSALFQRSAGFFADRMPNREVWRLYPRFREDTVFLDIETTGLSRHSAITVVGLGRADRFRALVRGQDLTRQELASELEDARMLVTFNGASFDLPMLRGQIAAPGLDLPHLDLRFLARRIGLSGGLKHIERELGLKRDREFAMMTGADAVHLWNLWNRRGNEKALDLLLMYNEADVMNLLEVADTVCDQVANVTFPGRE